MQLVKSNPKLFDGTGMFVAVQAGVLQQDVQASYEGASGRCFWIRFHVPPRIILA